MLLLLIDNLYSGKSRYFVHPSGERMPCRLLKMCAVGLVVVAALLATPACALLEDADAQPVPQVIETEQGPRSLAFDGEHVWTTLYGVQTVAKYTLDGRNVGNFKAGKYPRALAFDGKHMWVGNSAENTITKLSLDGEVLDTVSIGTPDTSPAALTFDGEKASG